MNYDRPFYHRSPTSFFERYSIRLLLGGLGSLAVIGILLNLPVFYSSPQVGWTTQRSAERIALSELPSEDTPLEADRTMEEESEADQQGFDPPPPTRHTLPTSEPTPSSTSANPESGSTPRSEEPDAPSEIRTLAALTTEDQHPQIKGGSGALYLQIRYPEAARNQGIQGRLKLEFTVDREGEVHAIEVAESLHPLCDSAAVQALRSVEFLPAKHEGTPIPVRMLLPIRFQLQPDYGGPLHTHRRRPSSR